MVKIRVNKLPEFLTLSSILIISILLSISIIKEYIVRKDYLEYEKTSMENRPVPEKQIHLLRRNVRISPANADVIFGLGKSYVENMAYVKDRDEKRRLYHLAREAFLKALIHKPTDGRQWAQYAWYIGLNGESNEAIECFEKAILLQKDDAVVHSLYARWCINLVKNEIDLEDPDRCSEMNRDIRNRDESIQDYDNRFINGISISAFLERAQIEWNKAFVLKATRNDAVFNVMAFNSLADLALIRCDIDKAIGNYNAADNKMMLARCYLIKGNYGGTIGIIAGIIGREGPDFQENLPEIRKLLKAVIDADPGNHKAFYYSGIIYNKLGLYNPAIRDLNTAVRLNPQHIESHQSLAELYELKGQTDLAIKEYEVIISLNPNHKKAIYLLGEAMKRKN